MKVYEYNASSGEETFRDMTPEEIFSLQQIQNEITEPPKTKLYKSTIIRRLTVPEAETLETILQAENSWMRLMWQSIDYLLVSDALVAYLHMVLLEEFGEARADEILEMEA